MSFVCDFSRWRAQRQIFFAQTFIFRISTLSDFSRNSPFFSSCVQSDKSRPSSYTPFFVSVLFFCLQFFTGRKGRVHKLMRLRRCEKKKNFSSSLLASSLHTPLVSSQISLFFHSLIRPEKLSPHFNSSALKTDLSPQLVQLLCKCPQNVQCWDEIHNIFRLFFPDYQKKKTFHEIFFSHTSHLDLSKRRE